MANETVERERPARVATSFIVGLAFNADAFYGCGGGIQ